MTMQQLVRSRVCSAFYAVAGGTLLAVAPVLGANVLKLDTSSMAANTGNWSAAPATTDVGEFDATCSAANLTALTLGGNLTLGGLQFDGTMAGPATIQSGSTLTLGTSGISMAAANQDVTVNCGIGIGGNQTWNVTAGRVLSLASGVSASSTARVVTKSGDGTLNVNGLVNLQSSGGGEGLLVTGGTLNGTGVVMGRNSYPSAGVSSIGVPVGYTVPTGNGFYVNGVSTVVNFTNASTTSYIGYQNSGATMRIDGGAVAMAGPLVLGRTTNSRYSICQVNGGSLSNSNSSIGLQLAVNSSATANSADLYLTGGVTSFEKIGFGASADTVGGNGYVTLAGGTLYVGSGGIVRNTTVAAYNARICLNSGTLGAKADWSTSVDATLNGTVTVQAADAAGTARSITLGGNLSTTSGTGSIVKTGNGTLILAGTNSYSGTTTISAGTLQVGNGGVAGTLGAGDAAGLPNSGTLAFKRSDDVTYAGVVSGTGALSQRGAGALRLTNANTYEGGTTVSSGRLLANNTSGSATGSGAVTLQGGLLGGTGSVSGSVTADAGGGLAPGDGLGTFTVNALTMGAGATNSFEFNAAPGNDQAIVATADGFVLNGGVFALYAEGESSPWTTPGTYNLIQYSGTLSGSGTDGSGNLTSDWTTGSAFNPHVANPQPGYSYVFGLSDGWLTLTILSDVSVSKGTWTGSSDGNWSVAGNWTAENGTMPPLNARDQATLGESTALRTVTLDAAASLGTLYFSNPNSFAVANGGYSLTLDKAGSVAVIGVTAGATNQLRCPVALSDNVSVSVTNGAALFITGRVSNAGAARTLDVSGGGTLALSGENAYGPGSGATGTTFSGGTLQLGHGNALGAGDVSFAGSHTLRAGGSNLTLSNRIGIAAGAVATVDNAGNALTLLGVVGGDGMLVKAGAGTLGINTANTYAGGTVIGGGLVSLNVVGASLGSGGVTLTNAATLSLYRGNADDDSSYPGFTVPLSVPAGESGTLWHSPRGTLSSSLSGAGTLNLRVNYVRGEVTGNWSGFTGQVNVSARTGGDDFRISVGGSGTATGLNMPSGKLHLGAGVVMLQTVNPPNSGNLTTTHHLGELAGATGSRLSGNPVSGRFANWSVGALNTDSTFAGVIQNGAGAAMLTKVGTGTLTLTATNTYTGATAVNVGTLRVDGVITGSVVTVASGAKLSGSGTLGGPVTLASGAAAISLTNGVAETLTLANGLTLNAGNVLTFDVGATSDAIAMTGGTFTRNGTVTVKVNPLAGYTGRTCNLVSGLGITDAAGFVLEGAPAEWKVRLVASGGALQLKNSGGTVIMAQ